MSLDGVLVAASLHRGGDRSSARDEGRPGRRLGPRLGLRRRPRTDRSSLRRVSAILRPMDGVVLVLNQNYEPLNVCNLPRAFRLLFGERAEVIEYDHQVIRTPRTEYRAPSVIRLQHLIRRPRPRVKLSRREVFVRDQPHLPVLRAPVARPDPGPRRAAPSWWRTHVGQPRRRRASRAITARAARPWTRRTSASAGRHSSLAATSTRSSRRTWRTIATTPGARTCSWAGTDLGRGRGERRIADVIPDCRPGPAQDALGGRSRRIRGRRIAARRHPGS